MHTISPRWTFVALLAWSLAATATAADTPARPGPHLPSNPVFTALLTDATTVTAQIRQLDPRAGVTLAVGDEAERVIPFDRLVKLTREGTPPPIPPDGTLVLFPEGDRLRGILGTAGEADLEVNSYVLGELSIPLEAALALVLSAPSEPETLDALVTRLRQEPRTAEVLWLANGDRLTGGFLGMSPESIALQAEAGRVEVARAGATALAFDPALVSYPRPEGVYLDLTLADGSRLGVTDARLDEGQLRAKARFGRPIRLPLTELARIHVRGGSVSYLSERDEAAVQYVNYLGPTRPYRRDATVEGHPFLLAGQPYDRGLGTQSRTLLAYKLQGGGRRFQAIVGVDDRAGPLGNVVFRVLVDGKPCFASPAMSARDTPAAIDVDVSGARVLILMTEFGERGGVRDVADWVEARVVR
ncbi:MAG TPA: NPCBM/NEW2 domain-containing protein [Isosphaeraceae bacterium]|jgi:hypothetical protein